MSTTAPPPVETAPARQASVLSSEADRLIEERIVEACRALWWAELTRSVLKLVIASIGIVLLWVVVDQWIFSPGAALRSVIFVALVAAGLWHVAARVLPLLSRTIRPEYAARSLERDFPELRQSLTSYVALRDDREGARLRHRVVRSIGAATAGHLRSHDELPSEATGTLRWWIGTAIALALLLAYAVASPKNSFRSAARLAAPLASIKPAMRVSIADVQPGNTEAVAGRTVAVSAKVDGLRDGEEVVLRWTRSNIDEQTVLDFDSETRRHVGELPLAHSDGGLILYTIEAGDGVAGPFELTVQDVPVVAIQSIHYTPPTYTRQSAWTGSGGAIHALDGTQVKIFAATNRPVVKAKIEFNPRPLGTTVQATAGATEMEVDSDGTTLSVAFPLRSARGRSAAVELDSYRISVWDSADQRNPRPIIYPIRVVTDLAPEVAIMLPTKSPKDLPIDSQQVIEIHASDPDFGLQRISLEIRSGIDLIDQPVLWSDQAGAKGNRIAEYRLRPSEHGLRIGDTVNVIAVATDNRLLEHDRSVEPNTSRTDAIELKIVASQPPPRVEDPEADGVSAPDDRPASEHGEQNSGAGSQEGEQQGGGGGSDGEGQQQQSESQGGDQGSSQPGESGQAEKDPSGSGSSDPSGSGDSSPQDPSQGEPSDGEPSNSNESPGESADPSRQGDSSGEPSEQNPDQQAMKPGADGERTPSGNAKQQAGDAQSRDGSSRAGTDQNRPGSQGQEQGGQPEGAADEQQRSGDAPQHDGEAFERIREHLEQKRNQQQGGQQQDNQQPGNEQQTGESPLEKGGSGQESGDPTKPSQSTSERGTEGEPVTEGESSPKGESEQGTEGQSPEGGQPQQSQSSKTGDQQSQTDRGKQGESSAQDSGEKSDAGEKTDAGDSPGSEGQTTDGQSGQDSGKPRDGKPADGKPADGKPADGKPADGKPSGDESSASKPTDGTPGDPSQSKQPGDKPSDSQSTPGKPQSSQSSSDPGTGGEGESKGGDTGLPPEQANAEFAKQATDMVLDYLKDTRDKPDRELLDKLNWSEDDLKRFADRWQKVRDIADNNSDPKAKREINEVLKSLGMRPKPLDPSSNIRESADSLRSIRDSGNRKPPPAAYRDAFDAFRRAAGRSK